jgi:hypothetical protein
MTRLYGWAPKGERLTDKVPHGHWKTATFLAALRSDRIDAPCLFDGPINGERFRAYVEQFLVPTLKAGDVVILDNLGSHKAKSRSANLRGHLRRLRRNPQTLSRQRMRRLPQKRRLCVKPKRQGGAEGDPRRRSPPRFPAEILP